MQAHEFRNALRIIFSLDEVADVLRPEKVREFHRDPFREIMRMDAETWAKVYALIEARQPKKRRHKAPVAECFTCDLERKHSNDFHPPHDASPNCQSGGRNHCSCDTCF